VRSSRDGPELASAIRSKLRELDSGLPAFLQTWNQEMNGALFASRMATMSLGVLGMMGAMLSITGIFEWRPTRSASGCGNWAFASHSAHSVLKCYRQH